MKRVLFDTDVILDVLLQRQPYFSTSALALDTVGQGKIEGFVAGHCWFNYRVCVQVVKPLTDQIVLLW